MRGVARGQGSGPQFDHLGIAVEDLELTVGLYSSGLGLPLRGIEVVADQKVRVAMLALGEGNIELLEPTEPNSPVAAFLGKKGQGIHHLAIRVGDIRAALEQARAQGMTLIDAEPRRGAGGRLVAFIHPRSTAGVLVELVEEKEAHFPGDD